MFTYSDSFTHDVTNSKFHKMKTITKMQIELENDKRHEENIYAITENIIFTENTIYRECGKSTINDIFRICDITFH